MLAYFHNNFIWIFVKIVRTEIKFVFYYWEHGFRLLGLALDAEHEVPVRPLQLLINLKNPLHQNSLRILNILTPEIQNLRRIIPMIDILKKSLGYFNIDIVGFLHKGSARYLGQIKLINLLLSLTIELQSRLLNLSLNLLLT